MNPSMLWSRFTAWLSDLEDRERYLVIGAIATLMIGILVLGLSALAREQRNLRIKVGKADGQIQQTLAMLREIDEIDEKLKEVELPLGERCSVNLFTALESILRSCGAENISIRPMNVPASTYYTEQAVEIEARQLLLKTLTGCLYQIDQSPSQYRAWRFQAKKRFDDPNLLDARFQVSTFCGKKPDEEGTPE